MCSEITIGNKHTHHVKVVNILRAVIYIFAMVSQIFWAWVNNPSNPYLDPLIILVPMVLAVTDLVLLYLSDNDPRRFWNVLPVVSVIAILVAINTIWITIVSGRWYTPHNELFSLGLLVIFASVYEIILWVERNQLIMTGLEESRSDELRTYDV
ncbi:MAG: hypothetical protein ACW98Y_07990 [Candidatus Thorarchaeota archaeon]